MSLWQIWLNGFGAVSALMAATWVASVVRRDVSLVDRVWGMAFVVAAWVYAWLAGDVGPRGWLVVAVVSVWGLRLSVHITWRNWGPGEDKRYRAMRDRRPETFGIRSLVTVFGLQALLAALVSMPLLAAIALPGDGGLGVLDAVAVVLWLVGFGFESVGDLQLARFRADPANRGKVMDRGLWRWTRHPNYFGDAVVWWSYGVFAVAAGGWWAVLGSVLMTVLIVKVSGVALTGQIMCDSYREGYEDDARRTNAFFPGPRASVG